MARRSDIAPGEGKPSILSRLLDDAVARRPDELALVADGERRISVRYRGRSASTK